MSGSRTLSLDIGTVRVGYALTDELGVIVSNSGYWDRSDAKARLDQLLDDDEVGTVVYGWPILGSGDAGAQTEDVAKFILTLSEKQGVTFIKQDESYTSVVAEERLKLGKKKYTKGDIDAEAAVIILESYLENI